MYELTENNFWKKEAILYTEKLAVEPYKPDPRVEFKIISSFGNGFRLTQSEEYKEILNQIDLKNNKIYEILNYMKHGVVK